MTSGLIENKRASVSKLATRDLDALCKIESSTSQVLCKMEVDDAAKWRERLRKLWQAVELFLLVLRWLCQKNNASRWEGKSLFNSSLSIPTSNTTTTHETRATQSHTPRISGLLLPHLEANKPRCDHGEMSYCCQTRTLFSPTSHLMSGFAALVILFFWKVRKYF